MKVYALVSFCGRGSIRLYDIEHEAKESLALTNRLGCGAGCSHRHRLIQLDEVIG